MKCRFPIAQVDEVTIAVLLAETCDAHLGLLLHAAPKYEFQDPSKKVYYVMWAFEKVKHDYDLCRLVHLGRDLNNLCFRGKPVKARGIEILENRFSNELIHVENWPSLDEVSLSLLDVVGSGCENISGLLKHPRSH